MTSASSWSQVRAASAYGSKYAKRNVTNGTNGTDRGSVASASNLGVNVGANAGVAGTVHNNTNGQNTGIIGG
ncbi:hypothetical protein OOZ51_05395 [Arthrobacter sp. MI7-26]|uniref:hypothetical protein n=1 Tax=Arthrobacter sp. MI7-26 TaxID=2993653 RepID=UPI0022496607|nr:hypothetical protein [Arthrobacter sp. MI7-26]MCX2747250.1 hypothetical protein [Arthrobacter sp. MI7-26]